MNSNKKRNVQFFRFLPYGLCSKNATILTGRSNPYSHNLLLGEDPNETIKDSEKYRKNATERALRLCENGLVKDCTRACGSPAKDRGFRKLTKDGLAALIDIPDIEMGNIEDDGDCDGIIKGTPCRSQSTTAIDMRDDLYDLATNPDPNAQALFQSLLLNSVQSGCATPFAAGLKNADSLKISTSNLSQNQLYNIWRLSHIQAMFLLNGHLTYLDRRPYDTGFAIGNITDDDSYNAHVAKNGNTLPAYVYRTLNDWYSQNPGFYQIAQQESDDSNEAKEQWRTTPAFYATSELPNFKSTSQENDRTHGSQQRIYHTHLGLAVGKNVNYAVYHTKPGSFKWIVKIEEKAKMEIEEAVRCMKTSCPDFKAKDRTDFALLFCPTRHQFLQIFAKPIQRHKEKKAPYCPAEKPYTSVHVIPINDTGTFLLWSLLGYSPDLLTRTIYRSLIKLDDNFGYATHPLYPLTYKGKRVFPAYTMDIKKINQALVDHLNGLDFYICCFPEQVSWYRLLFPGKTFL